MKRAFAFIACIVSCLGSFIALARADESGQQNNPVFPYQVQRTVLANGLTVITVPFDSPGTMSYYTLVRTGSRNEVEPGLSGFAHFFEHMMFRGTSRWPSEKYNDALKQFGADSNAFTTDDWTAYHTTASAAALETVIELEADRFQNLSYDRPAFQKEARAVLGEYNKIASSPMLLLDEKLQDTAFTKHTYKHTTIGFLKDIVEMPNQYEYSKKFFERWYRPDNCIVLVAGDVKHSEVVQLARRHYGGWRPGTAHVEIQPEPPQREERRVDLTWKNPTLPHLYIGYHVPAFDPRSRDVAALDVLAEAVFAKTSPLYRRLVLESGKVQDLSAGAPFRRDPALFTVLARLRDAKDLPAVEQAVYAALADAGAQPLDAQRLADIKSHLRYSFLLDSTDAVAGALGNYLQLTKNPDAINQIYGTYDATTAEDVMRVARKYFPSTNRTVVSLVSTVDQARTSHVGAERLVTAHKPLSDQQSSKNAPYKKRPSKPQAQAKSASPRPQLTHVPSSSTHVAFRVLLHAGSMHDPPGKEGLAALTARLIEEGGTADLSYQQLLEKLYPIAGEIGSSCDKEVTVFTGKVHRDRLEQFYQLFADSILRPRFEPVDFERLRQEQLNYLAATLRGNDDEELGKWALQLMLYRAGHPYGHVDQGTVAGLKSITLEDVKSFYKTHYTRASVELGIAGQLSEAVATRMQRDFQTRMPATNPVRPRIEEVALPEGEQMLMIEKPAIATAISLGFPVDVTRADDDFYLLAVANSALGEHRTFNGRLMINMRAKRGLNYGDYSYIENFIQDDSGGSRFALPNIPRRQQYFSIWLRPIPHDKAAFALRQALRELQLFVRNGLTKEEFAATRKFLFNYSKLWTQTPSRRLGYEMDGRFYGRGSIVEELARRLPDMTLDQVNSAIKRHLQSNGIAIAVVTENAERLRDQLLSGKPTPLVYDTQGTPQEVLAEDKRIAAWPLNLTAQRVKIVPVSAMFEGAGLPEAAGRSK